jgi:molybdopterin/thiamine biosynthesis adenylyltransferase/rhodanese-related sulfurtransferase
VACEIAPAELAAHPGGVTLLDVRGADEAARGMLAGARLVAPEDVVGAVRALGVAARADVVVYCASGKRSRLAVERLRAAGLEARSLAGGLDAWRAAGLPVSAPAAVGGLDAAQLERYSRHLRLAEIGLEGQRKLRAARILCVGAGGLGSPAALYLAAAGVGELGIVDADVVELSNLQRQVLHATDRIGRPKTESAVETLAALNPDVRVTPHRVRLTAENARDLLAGYDVILDASDNFATRYAINDAALALGRPVIHAAIQGFEGQLTAFGPRGRPCYRCLFPAPPPPEAAPSCAEAGVLGVLPGILGTLQAAEALKLVLGLGEPLAGRLVVLDALALRFHELEVSTDPGCACAPPLAPRVRPGA